MPDSTEGHLQLALIDAAKGTLFSTRQHRRANLRRHAHVACVAHQIHESLPAGQDAYAILHAGHCRRHLACTILQVKLSTSSCLSLVLAPQAYMMILANVYALHLYELL